MASAHFMADAMAARFDALHSVYDPRAVFYLMVGGNPSATAARGLAPIEVQEGTRPEGQIRRGCVLERRRFDREGSPLPPALLVAIRGVWTAAVLRSIRGFARVERGAETGELFAVSPAGVVHQPAEGCYRFIGEWVMGDWPVPVVALGALLLESGDHLLLESGGQLVLESA